MSIIKKSISNSVDINADTINVVDLNVSGNINGNITLAPNSQNPNIIQPGTVTVDEMTKLSEISGDIVDTQRAQTIQAEKRFNGPIRLPVENYIQFRTDDPFSTTNNGLHTIDLTLTDNNNECLRISLNQNINRLTNRICTGYFQDNKRINPFVERFSWDFTSSDRSLQLYYDDKKEFMNFSIADTVRIPNHNLRLESIVSNSPKLELYKGPTNHWDIQHTGGIDDPLDFNYNGSLIHQFFSDGDFNHGSSLQMVGGLLKLGPSSYTPISLLDIRDTNPVVRIEGLTSSTLNFSSPDSKIDFGLSGQNIYMNTGSDNLQFRNGTTTYARFSNSGTMSIGSNSNIVSNVALNIDSSGQNTLLLPRLNTAQRDVIPTPLQSMFFYNTTSNDIQYYNGSGYSTVLHSETVTAQLDVLNEQTNNVGVTIDGILLKDNEISNLNKLTVDNIEIDGNIISSTTGDININPNGSNFVQFGHDVKMAAGNYFHFRNTFSGDQVPQTLRFDEPFTGSQCICLAMADDITIGNSEFVSGYHESDLSTNPFIKRFGWRHNNQAFSAEILVDGVKYFGFTNTYVGFVKNINIANSGGYYVNEIKVVGPQMPAIVNATGSNQANQRINDILVVLRAHGLIAT